MININKNLETNVSEWFTDRNITIETSSLEAQKEKFHSEYLEQCATEKYINLIDGKIGDSKEDSDVYNILHNTLLEKLKDDIGDQLVVLRGMINFINQRDNKTTTYSDYYIIDRNFCTVDIFICQQLLRIFGTCCDYNLDPNECLKVAYMDIKDRDGYVLNKTYVKMQNILTALGYDLDIKYVKDEHGIIIDTKFFSWDEVWDLLVESELHK